VPGRHQSGFRFEDGRAPTDRRRPPLILFLRQGERVPRPVSLYAGIACSLLAADDSCRRHFRASGQHGALSGRIEHRAGPTHQGPAKPVNTDKFLPSHHHHCLLEIHETLVFLQKQHFQDGVLLQLADYERLVNHLITDASR